MRNLHDFSENVIDISGEGNWSGSESNYEEIYGEASATIIISYGKALKNVRKIEQYTLHYHSNNDIPNKCSSLMRELTMKN